MRVQDENVDVVAATATFNRGRAGIARCRPHDDDLLLSSLENIIKQPAQQLQCKIFERQRRTVEQF